MLSATAMPKLLIVSGLRRGKHHFACVLLATMLLATAGALSAQVLMPVSGPGGAVRLFTSDAAILESQEVRKDIPCTVTPNKPQLGFDLKYHSGYEVSLALKELAGSDNQLTM